jgi:hypothetical protein
LANVALITVHGMGNTPVDYAATVIRDLRRLMGAAAFGKVSVCPAYYQSILKPNEREVWGRIDLRTKLHYDELRKFILYGFADALGLENSKEMPGSVYEEAQILIARAFLAARERLGGDGPVVFLSQSLGCQVLSSYLYDAQKAAAGGTPPGIWRDIDGFALQIAGRALGSAETAFLAGTTCEGWITTGCNIPIFVAAHKRMEILPIARPTPNFKWINIYDRNDVLGWPLQPLSDGYELLVEDRAINAGKGLVNWLLKSWNPLSHSTYWTDHDVLDPLADMLRDAMRM